LQGPENRGEDAGSYRAGDAALWEASTVGGPPSARYCGYAGPEIAARTPERGCCRFIGLQPRPAPCGYSYRDSTLTSSRARRTRRSRVLRFSGRAGLLRVARNDGIGMASMRARQMRACRGWPWWTRTTRTSGRTAV